MFVMQSLMSRLATELAGGRIVDLWGRLGHTRDRTVPASRGLGRSLLYSELSL